MSHEPSFNALPFGLLELDGEGTVLYFKPEQREIPGLQTTELIGQNFFTAITPIAEAGEFRERIRSFKRSHAPAESFHFTFGFENRYLSVRVLLARIREQSELGSAESVLIHIRPEADKMAA
ncbi:MAG TPA: PAS domain-containing protein [Pyrinomonadaceae bacterium]|jgi:photoactive yellow protein